MPFVPYSYFPVLWPNIPLFLTKNVAIFKMVMLKNEFNILIFTQNLLGI